MAEKSTQNTPSEYKICVSFFDATNPGKAIYLQDAKVEIELAGESCQIDIEGGPAKASETPRTKEYAGLPDRRLQYITIKPEHFRKLLSNLPKHHEPLARLSLAGQPPTGCTRYVSSGVFFQLNETPGESYCVPVPLQQVQEACRIRFHAFDTSLADYIENAKAFLNGVEWTITAVQTPTYAHGAARQFEPFTAVARSVEGIADVPEVPLHQLYRIEKRGPEGYIGKGPTSEYVYVCCERLLSVKSLFCPCGSKPQRSVIFVQQECTGMRWTGAGSVLVGGSELPVDGNGIANIPEDMDDIVPISWPGKMFTPAMIDLRKGAAPVSTIAVSDRVGALPQTTVRGRFVDTGNQPFVRRPLSVLLPNGDEVQVFTDEQGFFEAPRGSRIHAREDQWGAATEPILLTEEV